jgi:hypothetical protein
MRDRQQATGHAVTLMMDDQIVSQQIIPFQDPRFVKDYELLEIAYNNIQERMSRSIRMYDTPIPAWNRLSVSRYSNRMECDMLGNKVRR